MSEEKKRRFWSDYFIEKPKIFFVFYIIVMIVLITMIIWFGWKGGNGFYLQNKDWILVYLLFMHGIFSPLVFYFRKKEQKK